MPSLTLSPGSPLPTGPVGTPYSLSFTATGGNPADTFGYSETGALPEGLTLSSSGQLSGTPDQAGSYTFTVTATDATNPTLVASQTYALNVGLRLSPATLAPGSVGRAYLQNLTASGGSGLYDYSVQVLGPVPGWLNTGSSSGSQEQLTGTPTTSGSTTLVVTATDQTNPDLTASRTYTLLVGDLTVSGPSSGLPPATVGTSYDQTFTAAGGSGNYRYSITGWQNNLGQSGGELPDGLMMSPATGELVGTPSQPGQYTFTVTARDGTTNAFGTQVFTLVVFPAPQPVPTVTGALTLSPDNLPPGTWGNAYGPTRITAAGGGPGDTYSYAAIGALPPGMSLQPDGLLGGTPTRPGTYAFTVAAADDANAGLTGSRQYTLTVNTNGLPATFATALKTTVAGSGQVLPSGTIYLASTAGLSPSGGVFSIPATDPYGNSATVTVTCTGVDPVASALTGCTNPRGDDGDTLASGSVISHVQNLPTATLSVASTSGFPASGGTLAVQTTTGTALVTYTGMTADSFTGCSGGQGTQTTGDAVTAPLSLSPTVLPEGIVSDRYQPFWGASAPQPPPYQIVATGGTGRYTYQVTGGALPPGLFLSPTTGQLTGASGSGPGTPTQTGTFDFTVTATDGAGQAASQDYQITVLPKPPGHYSPQQIRHAYGIDDIILSGGILGDGTGQTVAILAHGDDPDFVSSTDPDFDASDLHQFDASFGLPDPPSFLKLDAYGGTQYPPTGDVKETAQDVEWVHALAPGANIVLFEGSAGTALQTALNYPGVTVISNSYASGDTAGESAKDDEYLAPAGKDVTFVTASGDNNPEAPPPPTVYPASSPYVLAVGMTELAADSQGNYVGEAGNALADWGASKVEAQPAYQNGTVSAVSGTQRTTPDVAFVGEATSRADSGTARLVGGVWSDANGTSLATPAWAALLAIANQGRALTNQRPLNGPTDTLPMLYNLPAGDFHKISYLDNGSVSQGGTGYNQSGLGSPVANLLVPGLVGGTDAITGRVTAGGAPAAGWTVFLDANHDGRLDPGEARTTTDGAGAYAFVVAPGSYSVRVAVPGGWTQATPNPAAITFVAGQAAAPAGADFTFQAVPGPQPDPQPAPAPAAFGLPTPAQELLARASRLQPLLAGPNGLGTRRRFLRLLRQAQAASPALNQLVSAAYALGFNFTLSRRAAPTGTGMTGGEANVIALANAVNANALAASPLGFDLGSLAAALGMRGARRLHRPGLAEWLDILPGAAPLDGGPPGP